MLNAAIQQKISRLDCILFKSQVGVRIGMVSAGHINEAVVLIFKVVTSEISERHFLPPITAVSHPMAHHGNIVEVIAHMDDEMVVPRECIID
jgi:hypothetical protein